MKRSTVASDYTVVQAAVDTDLETRPGSKMDPRYYATIPDMKSESLNLNEKSRDASQRRLTQMLKSLNSGQ